MIPKGSLAAYIILAACIALFTGCGWLHSSGGSGKLTSTKDGSSLSANFTTRVYAGNEINIADVYLTDLPRSVWQQGGDVSELSGNILHIHMFVEPLAGHTPIERTASSATVRWLVLTKGRVGVYGGGGFFSTSGDVGKTALSGSLTEATLRLIHASPGFTDRLGPCVLSQSVDAKHDESEAALISRAMIGIAESAAQN